MSLARTRHMWRLEMKTCATRHMLSPVWGAFKTGVDLDIPDFLYVEDDYSIPKVIGSAASVTSTPKGDAFGLTALEYALLTRPPRTAAEKAKNRTRAKTQRAVARAEIAKGLCEVCGSSRTEAHHDDYSNHLDVRWFCRRHHDHLHHPAAAA